MKKHITDLLIEFENDNLSPVETVKLFQLLIDTKLAYKLDTRYLLIAEEFICAGACKENTFNC